MERIGFAGLGTMGASMAANLARAGAPLTLWNRTPGRAQALLALGAREARTPAELAASSDVLVICVSDTPDVEAVLFGRRKPAEGSIAADGSIAAAGSSPAEGSIAADGSSPAEGSIAADGSSPAEGSIAADGSSLAAGLRAGSLVIDCSTISPEATREFGRRLAERGVAMVDAPVSGGSEGARLGTLTIFAGGTDADVARARPVLEAMGKTITHLGPLGNGQAAKAVNQVIIAGAYLGVAEGIVLGLRAGLDPHQLVAALSGGAAQSWVLANRSGRMIDDEYPLGFRVALHRKDLGIALEMARGLDLDLPAADLVAGIEDELMAAGFGDEDMSALARAIRGGRGVRAGVGHDGDAAHTRDGGTSPHRGLV